MIKKRILKKIISLILCLLLLFNPVAARFAWAQEAETSGDSSITTGDASATSEVETTANTNEDTVAGEITTPPGDCTPPEGETSCPEDVVIENSNSAEVADSAGSQATTGDNQITGAEGDATITTGDATATGTIANEVNSNTVILEPTPEPSPGPEVNQTNIEGQSLTVENSNEGTVTNEAQVAASTGENLASKNLGDVEILTGDALALANLLTLLNTNIVGSNFEVLFLDLLGGNSQDINLNELWQQLLEMQAGSELRLAGETSLSNLSLIIRNLNQANLENTVEVEAQSGANAANENGGNASVATGDATALANVTNIVNTNIVGSQFFFGVINILGFFEGNLILPRPESFSQESSGTQGVGGVVFENQNQAEITDAVSAGAETGLNETNGNAGDNLITTGDATSVANSFSLVNLNILRNNWFFLLINNLGTWTGRIFGWSAPSATEDPSAGPSIFELGLEDPVGDAGGDIEIEQELLAVSFQNQNEASLGSDVRTFASTGQNQANGNLGGAEIRTGKARSLANLFNLVNLNILGGRFFVGLVNILNDWTGNLVYAYPDVSVSLGAAEDGNLTPGEEYEYVFQLENRGSDQAGAVNVSFELPDGTIFLGDSSGVVPQVSGQTYSWSLGTLGRGEVRNFNTRVRVDPGFSFEEPISFWPRLIPEVQAAENEKSATIVASAWVTTSDPESDLSNNKTSLETIVYSPSTSASENTDPRLPKLEISAWNNVNVFVYPGDTVTFVITVKNTADVPSYDTKLIQRLYNTIPGDFGTAEFDLGTLKPGESGKLTFGMKLANDGLLPTGPYYTIAQAFGKASNGTGVSSNTSRTDFEIRAGGEALTPIGVMAKEEEVLGETTNSCPEAKEDILPYVFLLLLSTAYLTNWTRIRFKLK